MAIGFDWKRSLGLAFSKISHFTDTTNKCKISYMFVKDQRTKKMFPTKQNTKHFPQQGPKVKSFMTTTFTIDVHGNLQEPPKCSMFTANFWVAQLFRSQMQNPSLVSQATIFPKSKENWDPEMPQNIRHQVPNLLQIQPLEVLLSYQWQGRRWQAHSCNNKTIVLSTLERFRDSHFTDRITYRQSVKLIRNLEFRASFAQLYVYV